MGSWLGQTPISGEKSKLGLVGELARDENGTMTPTRVLVPHLALVALLALCSAQSLVAEDLRDVAEKGLRESTAKLDSAIVEFRGLLDEAAIEEWEGIEASWRRVTSKQASALAGLTSGGGSAYSVDYMHLLAKAYDERRQMYQEWTKRFGAQDG